jgi:hypothetical protein
MPTNQELKEVYAKKSLLRKDLFAASEKVLETSSILKKRKAFIVGSTEKKTLGTNDKERDAYILEHTADIVEELEELELEKRSLDLEYSLICDVIECLQWQIRNEQVEALNSGRETLDPHVAQKIKENLERALQKEWNGID